MPDDPSVGLPAPEALEALEALESERPNPATAALDRQDALGIVRLMNAEDTRVAEAVARELPRIARAVEAIAARLVSGGRLIYVGAGTSGRLGLLDAMECPPTFGVAPERIVGCVAGGDVAWAAAAEDAEDRPELGEADLRRLAVGPADSVVGIAASGCTPYVLGAIAYASARGALTIGIACNGDSPLERAAAITIAPLVGPEVIAGSSRLKAGTAQKMVLNMLSTASMVLLGKTYGNLMVDVRPANGKLRARAAAIVRAVAGVGDAEAASLLRACGGEVKTAIVAGRMAVAPAEARARLAAYGGHLRAVLEAAR